MRHMAESNEDVRVRRIVEDPSQSALRKYSLLTVGEVSLPRLLLHELVVLLFSGVPGGLGIFLRRVFYRVIFGRMGRGAVIGKHVTIRGGKRISLGNSVFIDDFCVIDARGPEADIEIGDRVLVSRGTVIRCRNGEIRIGEGGDIGCYCILASDSRVHIGNEVLIGAYSYLCGGGRHRFDAEEPVVQRQEMEPSIGITVGDGAWLAARTSVTDGAHVGEGAVIGAGSLVTSPVPAMSVAYGIPARVQRERREREGRG